MNRIHTHTYKEALFTCEAGELLTDCRREESEREVVE